MKNKKVVIVGAGPTGLSAGYRLEELGHKNYVIYEKNDYVGGLCASFVDDKSFIWDQGGHVIFSHYEYFNDLLNKFLGNGFLEYTRESYIWTMNRCVPYPFQNNIRYLPIDKLSICLMTFVLARMMSRIRRKEAKNFKDWIVNRFGIGIAHYFLFPYNFKVWNYPLEQLSIEWIDERLSSPGLKHMLDTIINDRDDIYWGPNHKFKYPSYGGIGEIFRRIGNFLNNRLILKTEVIKIDPDKKEIYLANGIRDNYDILINTSPLDKFLLRLVNCNNKLLGASYELKHNSLFIVGLGIDKRCQNNRCWIYFPDKNNIFFRVSYLSNYSPNNVPDIEHSYSLLCETAYCDARKIEKDEIVERTIQSLIDSKILNKKDKAYIVSRFIFDIDYAYPIPTLKRNEALCQIQSELERIGIYSRGRFGGWKYEIGNTDHSIMQGKEIADRIIDGRKETVYYI